MILLGRAAIKQRTQFLRNARDKMPTFSLDQRPFDELPKLKLTYLGSVEEIIACCTIVEGLIQLSMGGLNNFQMWRDHFFRCRD